MSMDWRPTTARRLAILLGILLAGAGIAWGSGSGIARLAGERTVDDVVADLVAARAAEGGDALASDVTDARTVRVLLLGLDARTEDRNPHCDAIHLLAIDTKAWTVAITSVPRGTYAYIPKEKLDWGRLDREAARKKLEEHWGKPDPAAAVDPAAPAPLPPPAPLTDLVADEVIDKAFVAQESYLANACAYLGLEEGVKRIEGVLGARADFVATVGFSQTMGALRLLGLPPVEGLQWLRHRQSYKLGDPQRSHNQATFLKDLLVRHVARFADPLMLPLTRVGYTLVDTDMPFNDAYALLRGLAASGIEQHPERITLAMRPAYETVDYHFDPEHPLKDLEAFYKVLAPRLDKKDFSAATVEDVQYALVTHLDERLASDKPVDDLFDKEIWLQVQDDGERERIHLAIVARSAHALADAGDLDGAIALVTWFVVEKQALGLAEAEQDGRALLADLLEEGKGAE